MKATKSPAEKVKLPKNTQVSYCVKCYMAVRRCFLCKTKALIIIPNSTSIKSLKHKVLNKYLSCTSTKPEDVPGGKTEIKEKCIL